MEFDDYEFYLPNYVLELLKVVDYNNKSVF